MLKKYTTFNVSKKNGQIRKICAPEGAYKEYLSKVNIKLEKQVRVSDSNHLIHGFLKKRSAVTNARAHIGYQFTVSMDLSDFFDSVTSEMLTDLVETEIITNCFIDNIASQGLPTSPSLANLAFMKYDEKILEAITKIETKTSYTRYADDITISFNHKKNIPLIIQAVTEIINNSPFEINKKKTKTQNAKNGRRIITGVGVDKTGVHPTRKTLRKIRAARFQNNLNSYNGLCEWSKCKLPSNK